MHTVARLTTSILSVMSVVAITLGLVLVGSRALADDPVPAMIPPLNPCPNCWKCDADYVFGENVCLQDGWNPFSLPGVCVTLEENVPPPCPEACYCDGHETVNGYQCACLN